MLSPENWQEYEWATNTITNTGGDADFSWRLWRITIVGTGLGIDVSLGVSGSGPPYSTGAVVGTVVLEPKGMLVYSVTTSGTGKVYIERIRRTPPL